MYMCMQARVCMYRPMADDVFNCAQCQHYSEVTRDCGTLEARVYEKFKLAKGTRPALMCLAPMARHSHLGR